MTLFWLLILTAAVLIYMAAWFAPPLAWLLALALIYAVYRLIEKANQ